MSFLRKVEFAGRGVGHGDKIRFTVEFTTIADNAFGNRRTGGVGGDAMIPVIRRVADRVARGAAEMPYPLITVGRIEYRCAA